MTMLPYYYANQTKWLDEKYLENSTVDIDVSNMEKVMFLAVLAGRWNVKNR